MNLTSDRGMALLETWVICPEGLTESLECVGPCEGARVLRLTEAGMNLVLGNNLCADEQGIYP